MLIIHTAAKLVTRVFEERVVVGGAAATFSVGGSAWTNSAWTIGSELTQFDADAAAIAKAIEEVVRFHLSSDSAPPSISYCRNVCPTWVKFNSKDTKESEWCSRF